MTANNKVTHRIRIQRVDVEFDRTEDAFKIREELSEVCRLRLVPAMEKLFDEKYAAGPLISIPHLVIDAGELDADNWENTFVNSVIRRLETFLDREAAREQGASGVSRAGAKGQGAGERKRRAGFILHYLKSGVQPWNSPHESKEQLKNELRDLLKNSRRFLRSVSFLDRQGPDLRDDFTRELVELLASDLNAVKRLVYLLPEKNILPVLIKKGWDPAEIRNMRKNWNAIFHLSGLPRDEHPAVFLHSLSVLHNGREIRKHRLSEALSQEVVRVLEEKHKPVFMKLPEVLEKYLILLPGKPVLNYHKEMLNLPPREKPVPPLIEEPVYINNAGLVLLHPFLCDLFENTGHTVNNKWDSREMLQRSIVLTRYLTSGQDDYSEHDLFLNKLLAGFPLEAPLPLDIFLSDFEKKEANDLLESVIGHWKALRNTSIEGLREAFLQRPGKISGREKGWLLQADQQVPDVLLAKLPWGFSTIKTPWMKEILTVEWT